MLRNQVKRRLREIVRTTWLPVLTQPADIVIRAFPTSYEVSFRVLREQMESLLQVLRTRMSEQARGE